MRCSKCLKNKLILNQNGSFQILDLLKGTVFCSFGGGVLSTAFIVVVTGIESVVEVKFSTVV